MVWIQKTLSQRASENLCHAKEQSRFHNCHIRRPKSQLGISDRWRSKCENPSTTSRKKNSTDCLSMALYPSQLAIEERKPAKTTRTPVVQASLGKQWLLHMPQVECQEENTTSQSTKESLKEKGIKKENQANHGSDNNPNTWICVEHLL